MYICSFFAQRVSHRLLMKNTKKPKKTKKKPAAQTADEEYQEPEGEVEESADDNKSDGAKDGCEAKSLLQKMKKPGGGMTCKLSDKVMNKFEQLTTREEKVDYFRELFVTGKYSAKEISSALDTVFPPGTSDKVTLWK